MKRKKLLIDEYFDTWISNFPESHHWADKNRFYSFVSIVCRYGRNPRYSDWLKKKIKSSNNNLSKEDIDYFCDLFDALQEFYLFIKH